MMPLRAVWSEVFPEAERKEVLAYFTVACRVPDFERNVSGIFKAYVRFMTEVGLDLSDHDVLSNLAVLREAGIRFGDLGYGDSQNWSRFCKETGAVETYSVMMTLSKRKIIDELDRYLSLATTKPADENPAADGIPRVGRRGRLCACSQDTLTEEDFQNRRVWLNPDNYMSYVPEGVFFPLGKGFFSDVYLGFLRSHNKKGIGEAVAYKVFQGHRLQQTQFLDELQLLKDNERPNLVRFIGANKGTLHIGYAMERMPHKNLHTRIRRDACPFAWHEGGGAIALGIATGLRDLHQLGIIHGDLTSSNVFLTADQEDGSLGIPKIADVGLSRTANGSDHFADGRFSGEGDPCWASPEQLRGREASMASDVYSLGKIMQHMFTGVAPVRDEMYFPLLEGEASDPLDLLIEECLNEDPWERPSAADVLRRLEGILREMHE